ncbi:basic proline-rich protein-like [Moschus berezovskii]|uniref:basic proline-rich protein-like n=1 Tax=Moschus berezovskii TaxID=68408 RepID=UPI002445269A|nr:basic proline-rich protein-like [Moschus berezovskii]
MIAPHERGKSQRPKKRSTFRAHRYPSTLYWAQQRPGRDRGAGRTTATGLSTHTLSKRHEEVAIRAETSSKSPKPNSVASGGARASSPVGLPGPGTRLSLTGAAAGRPCPLPGVVQTRAPPAPEPGRRSAPRRPRRPGRGRGGRLGADRRPPRCGPGPRGGRRACGPQPDPPPRPRSPREPVRTHLPTSGEGSTRRAPPLSNSRLQVERPGAERLRAGEVAENLPSPARRPRRARGPGRMLNLPHAAGRRDLPAPRRAPRGQAGSGAHTAVPASSRRAPRVPFSLAKGGPAADPEAFVQPESVGAGVCERSHPEGGRVSAPRPRPGAPSPARPPAAPPGPAARGRRASGTPVAGRPPRGAPRAGPAVKFGSLPSKAETEGKEHKSGQKIKRERKARGRGGERHSLRLGRRGARRRRAPEAAGSASGAAAARAAAAAEVNCNLTATARARIQPQPRAGHAAPGARRTRAPPPPPPPPRLPPGSPPGGGASAAACPRGAPEPSPPPRAAPGSLPARAGRARGAAGGQGRAPRRAPEPRPPGARVSVGARGARGGRGAAPDAASPAPRLSRAPRARSPPPAAGGFLPRFAVWLGFWGVPGGPGVTVADCQQRRKSRQRPRAPRPHPGRPVGGGSPPTRGAGPALPSAALGGDDPA